MHVLAVIFITGGFVGMIMAAIMHPPPGGWWASFWQDIAEGWHWPLIGIGSCIVLALAVLAVVGIVEKLRPTKVGSAARCVGEWFKAIGILLSRCKQRICPAVLPPTGFVPPSIEPVPTPA